MAEGQPSCPEALTGMGCTGCNADEANEHIEDCAAGEQLILYKLPYSS